MERFLRNSKWFLAFFTFLFVFSIGLVGQGHANPSADLVLENVIKEYYANMSSDNYKIDQNEFVKRVRAKEDVCILDIRQVEDYQKAHIKDAINAPWGPNFPNYLPNLPRDKKIYVYCYSGQTAGQTVALLNMAGFEAKSVNLGWNRGITKIENIEDIVVREIDPVIKKAIEDYYKGLANVKGSLFESYKITEEEAKNLLEAKSEDVIFLSIRKAEDFAKGHIAGAINIPFGNEMSKYFKDLPKDKKIIVYCYSGQTAGQTVATLRLLGYDAVSLNSGMGRSSTGDSGWENKGYPVVN